MTRTSYPAGNVKAFTVAAQYPFSPGPKAGCFDADPALFDPVDVDALKEAKKICSTCPVRAGCLQTGHVRSEWGVWGGELLENGVVRDAPRKMGRPRKARPVAESVPA